MTPEDLDRVITLVLDGVTDKRIRQVLRGPEWQLTAAKAKKAVNDAHKAIASQGSRPKEWHRANAFRLFSASLENANFRVALEAHKELARLDRVHDVSKPIDIKLDGTPESVTAMLQALIAGAINGEVSNNTLQATMPALRELMGHMAKTDTEEDLGEMDVGEMTVRDAVRHTLKMLRE
jgi:hypothetical protein